MHNIIVIADTLRKSGHGSWQYCSIISNNYIGKAIVYNIYLEILYTNTDKYYKNNGYLSNFLLEQLCQQTFYRSFHELQLIYLLIR